jgi:hypothetical protein
MYIGAEVAQCYRAGWCGVRVPAVGWVFFSSPPSPDRLWGPPEPRARAISLGVRRLGREADHSPPSSAEVKNSLFQYTSMAWCSVKNHRVNFTFTFLIYLYTKILTFYRNFCSNVNSWEEFFKWKSLFLHELLKIITARTVQNGHLIHSENEWKSFIYNSI